jgi:glycosyltransferase involved in cell wall biosynthesis
MRILVLNWRDICSPRGGGAERVTHEVAKRLVERGHEVTWLSSVAEGLPGEEVIDGVSIVRRGSEATTRLHARRVHRRVRPDVVLEEINTLPYFAPLWAGTPVLLYMNQLAREVWWYESPPLVAALGWLSEPAYLRAYGGCDAVTISLSTLEDLRALGLRGTITIAPMAVEARRVVQLSAKRGEGHLVAIGRLAPSKRYDHAIQALADLVKTHGRATLTLIGRGREEDRLRQQAAASGVGDAVRFLGHVSEEEKVGVLDTSDFLVGTSVREGWGLTVTEAAARGTAAVVYDIPGFRDAVVPGRTGLIVPPEPAALAEAVRATLDDAELFNRLRTNAWESVHGLSYDATADAFDRALAGAVSRFSAER